ncbi:L-asparagine transporter-like permease [Natronobacillus azotifigens]|uniref:Amino acid permease n=1 Tax=Natronobacillus azotifigens TaxID=472978 RepID=A0A9J6R9L5_9BACI|nr:amino acid permease [Natronobacillus azotifigens]MCZ0701961.1 amino acid permease [Natronobacillus azotifigens]
MKTCAKQVKQAKKIKWWQLSLIGVGCTIGTGFFLGSAIAIQRSGPMILLLFVLAALATYIVYDALSSMTSADPQKGSFRTYAKKAYGRWAGFSNGWVYWTSELLIMGSQLIAISIFAQFWFPNLPLWIMSSVFSVLGIGVIITGVVGFEKVENVFGAMKIAAILMFIIICFLALSGVFPDVSAERSFPLTMEGFFPEGFKGVWTGFIFVLYAFAGIEVMGIMSNELEDTKQAAKAGRVMISVLTIIYLLSIGLAVWISPLDSFSTDESPFIMVLQQFNFTVITHIFNGVLIIGGFSTMVASLYGITTILTSLAEDRDAPKIFAKTGFRDVPYYSVLVTAIGLVGSIVVALLLPDKIYEYITTAASLMLLYIWIFILYSYHKLIKITKFSEIKRWIGIGLLLIGIVGTLFDQTARIGFFISFGFIAIIATVTFFMRKKWH